MGITHTFVSAKADGGDATLVRPSNWNAEHTFSDVLRVLNRDVAFVDVVNTVAETSVYSFSVPGGTLSTNKALRLTLIGVYTNTTGSDQTMIIRTKYGGTNLSAFSFSGIPTQASSRGVRLTLDLSARGATNAQAASVLGIISNAGGVAGVGSAIGIDITGTSPQIATHATVAEDSTLAKTLEVTVQHGTASGALSISIITVQLELVG